MILAAGSAGHWHGPVELGDSASDGRWHRTGSTIGRKTLINHRSSVAPRLVAQLGLPVGLAVAPCALHT